MQAFHGFRPASCFHKVIYVNIKNVVIQDTRSQLGYGKWAAHIEARYQEQEMFPQLEQEQEEFQEEFHKLSEFSDSAKTGMMSMISIVQLLSWLYVLKLSAGNEF